MKLILIVAVIVIIISSCRQAFKRHNLPAGPGKTELSNYEGALYPVKTEGKWGYLNNRLEQVIPYRFLEADDFSEGLAAVSLSESEIRGDINKPVSENAAEKELYGFIDSSGTLVIDCKYDKVWPFSEGLAIIVKDGKYGYVNKKGEEVIAAVYEDAGSFSEGLAAVKLKNKNGFINKSGELVIKPLFTRACWVSAFSEGLAPVYFEDGSAGYVNKEGVMEIPAVYSYVSKFSEGLALVQPKDSHKYGYINTKGEMIIQPKFDLSLPFSEGIASVKVTAADGSYVFRLIDRKGTILADNLKYNFVGIFREGLAGVETYNYQWGFIDRSGHEVIRPAYASVRLFNNGLSRTQTGSLFTKLNTGYINKEGKQVIGKPQ